MNHPSWIEVDLTQLKANVGHVKGRIGTTRLCLTIKANAYGHGLIPIGKAAQDAGVDYLAVAHLQEGIALRTAGVRVPILVLGAIHEDQIRDLIHFGLEFTISSRYKADLVAKHAGSRPCRVHLEVDTGMQRTGVRCSTAAPLFEHLVSLQCFEVVGIYSHLANGSNPQLTAHQADAFNALLSLPLFQSRLLIRHLANSDGLMSHSRHHLDMVRPGLLVFGYGGKETPLAPCFSLKSRISYFKVVEAGEGISYGHSYVTPRRTRIVTVPIGYGDGYRRELSNRGHVLIRGNRFPIVGTICMDQLMVDIGDSEAYVGDEVTLIGKQGKAEISVEEVAALCHTIPYEVLCFFNERIPRVYPDYRSLKQ